MRREKHFEQVLEQHQQGPVPLRALDADDESRLAAADTFARLTAIEIPSDVAQRIEARVLNRAAALEVAGQHASLRRSPRWQASPHPGMHRALIAALGAVAVLFLTFLSITTVAANSLPGDPLYGVKLWQQHTALAWTGDQHDRASLQLNQLQQALADLNTVVQERRSAAAIHEALATVTATTQACQQATSALPVGSARDTLSRALANTLRSERQTLHQLLPQIDWEDQLAFTQQLGRLGEPIPVIAGVTQVESAEDTLTITITGKNFAPGARLVINGAPRGLVLSNTPTTLRVQIHDSDLSHHQAPTIGVANPDGTAAQIGLTSMPEHDQPGPGEHHGTPGTPHDRAPGPGDGEHSPMPGTEPPGTPEPGNMHGGHS